MTCGANTFSVTSALQSCTNEGAVPDRSQNVPHGTRRRPCPLSISLATRVANGQHSVTNTIMRPYNHEDAQSAFVLWRKELEMRRIAMAGLTALAPIVLLNVDASAGSVHVGFTKPEVEAARVRLYEHEMHLRDERPTAFDHKHPVLGKVLASEQGLDEFLKDHTFSKLWCVHTPFHWRVVYGDILYHRIHPFVTTQPFPEILTAPQQVGLPWEGGSDSHNLDPGGVIHLAAVPEPSSWVMMTAGLVFALLALVRRRIYRLATAAKRERAII
jgi:PEP-CTERM motif